MQNYNVIGDIAGNYMTLMVLLNKMPKDSTLLSLGDLNDRGPKSKNVIQYVMNNGLCLNSNHGHMFVDYYKYNTFGKSNLYKNYLPYYEPNIFFSNSGEVTLSSYFNINYDTISDQLIKNTTIPIHIKWLEKLPMFLRTKDYFFSHAPYKNGYSLKEVCNLGKGFNQSDYTGDNTLLWNRKVSRCPVKQLSGKINIFGHNSNQYIRVYTLDFPNGISVENNKDFQYMLKEKKVYGICLDTSKNKVLTGLHIPTMTIYQQEYIDG